jgi:hypothetical protein
VASARWLFGFSRRARWAVTLVMIGCVAVAGLYWARVAESRITRENCYLIDRGMSADEVTTILGSPNAAGEEPRWRRWFKIATRQPTEWYFSRLMPPGDDMRIGRVAYWCSLDTWISVTFDEDERVCGVTCKVALDLNKLKAAGAASSE